MANNILSKEDREDLNVRRKGIFDRRNFTPYDPC